MQFYIADTIWQINRQWFYLLSNFFGACFARKQLLLSACLSCPFVRPSHGWISQKQDHQIFTVGCSEDSSFRNRKAVT